MLLNAMAATILGAMMLVPLINIVVGAVVGTGLGGPLGGAAGILVALLITLAEKLIGDRRGWFRVNTAVSLLRELRQRVDQT